MKEKKMESMPVASRSRKQTELREKELRERNKRARLAARNAYWKRNAAKMSSPSLDEEEDVIVADESVYLKRTSRMGEKGSSQNVDVSFEESSDDSIQIVGERWNPLGAGFDNNEDGDDVDGIATDFQPGPSKVSSKGCSDRGGDNQSLSTKVDSEDSGGGGASDGDCSSPSLSTENDDNVSDEDFLVDEAEMHTVDGSESSQYYSGYTSEKGGKWKGKTSAKKINERFMEEDIQSSDEFDEDYLKWLKYHCCISSDQGVNAVNGGKRKRGRPPKNRSPGFECEADDGAISDNHYSSKKGSFVQSAKKRGRPRKNPCEIIRSESENGPIAGFAKSETGGKRKRGRPPKVMNVGVGSETEDELKPMSAYRKRGRPRKNLCEIIRSESESENDPIGVFAKSETGGKRKRGRPPKVMNVGVDSETESELKPMSGYRKRGRPLKNLCEIIRSESESENDPIGVFAKSETGGNRKRGRPPKVMNVGVDSETESELKPMSGYKKRGRPRKNLCEIIRSESESENDPIGVFAKSETGGSRKRGRPPKVMNVGVDSKTESELKPMSGYKKRGTPPKKAIVETESESEHVLVGEFGKFKDGGTGNIEKGKQPQFEENEDDDEVYLQWLRNLVLSGRCENGSSSKRGRPPKRMIVGVRSEPKNGVRGKRGTPPKNWIKGCDSERGYKRSRGRPPKNLKKEFDSERGCKRSRGRPPKMSRT